ncbi:MAG: DUF1844 domain-containing protein [bacterium]
MAENLSADQKNEVLFMQLVFTFHSAVMQHLGKIKNPLTDKIERNLEQARLSIDMLDMIKAKTEGKLSDNEKSLLERLIREAKMNYVDEVDKEQKAASAKPSQEKAETKKQEKKKEKAKASSSKRKKEQNAKS